MPYLQCNLSVSWKTQLILGIIYGFIILAILISPWPDNDWPIWLLLIIAITIEALFTQHRLKQNKGILALLDRHSLIWKDEKWVICRRPLMLSFGIFLTLRSTENKKRKHLWIAIDSVSKNDWRILRYELLRIKH